MRKGTGALALIACLAPFGAQAQAIDSIRVYEASTDGDPEMIRRSGVAGDMSDWFTPADYPAAAFAQKRGGEILLTVAIGPDDRVTGCRIDDARGAGEDLRQAACAIVRRGKFRHALDANGKPQPGRLLMQVVFAADGPAPYPMTTTPIIPPRAPLNSKARAAAPIDAGPLKVGGLPAGATEAWATASLTISAEGKVSRCRLRASAGPDAVDTEICRQFARAAFTPALDDAGNPIEQIYFAQAKITP